MKHEGMAVWRETHRGVTDIKTDTLYHSVNSCQKEKQVKEKPWEYSTHLQTILLLFLYIYICWSNLPYFVFQLCFLFIFLQPHIGCYTAVLGCVDSLFSSHSFIVSTCLILLFIHFSPVNPLNPPLEMRPIPALGRRNENIHQRSKTCTWQPV